MTMWRIKCTILAIILGFNVSLAKPSTSSDKKATSLNIAVIGSGAAGLTSAKNALQQGHKVVIFEKGGALGGIWLYTDETGQDNYGVEIHTPMYIGLRTNTPYQTMEFPDFPFRNGTQSYPSHDVIWNYLNSYSKHFQVDKFIKYHHLVEKVRSVPNDKWELTIRDLPNNQTILNTFDAVFVCTGINSVPNIPDIVGADKFKGKILHSHDYRKAEKFQGKNILVIGAGTSGIDIIHQLPKMASTRVTLSRRESPYDSTELRKILEEFFGCKLKGDVERFTSDDVEFKDGSRQSFEIVIFATGYKFSYPFLDESVDIDVENKYVGPLYKQILNVYHPTMAFIGVPYSAALNRMYDLQARFALKFISGAKQLPPFDVMLTDAMEDFLKKRPHLLSVRHKEYYMDLAQSADIENIPEVYADIYTDSLLNSTPDFRSHKYIIVDDSHFDKVKE